MKMKLFLILLCMSFVLTSCTRTDIHENDTAIGNKIDDILISEKEVDETYEITEESDLRQSSTAEGDNESKATGGANLCEVHSIDFHTFTGEMIEYVGEDRFNDWFESCSGKDSGIEGCIHYANIYRFIEYFDFPKEVFEKLYYGTIAFYFSDYDVDLLYGTNESTVSQYYMSYAEREEEREKYSSLGEIKIGIVEYAMMSDDEKMKEFFDMYCADKTIVEWSIADFVKTTTVSEQELQAIIGNITVREYPGMTIVLDCFDFDYDALYDDSSELMTARTTEEPSVIEKHNEDLMFCRQSKLNMDVVDEDMRVD